MSHRGNGVHGEWRNQSIRSFDRMNQVFGYGAAWNVFIGEVLPALPPEAEDITSQRRLAQKTRASSIRTAKAAYNKRRRQLASDAKRETITWEQFNKLDDDAYAKCNALMDAAEWSYADAVRELGQTAVTNG